MLLVEREAFPCVDSRFLSVFTILSLLVFSQLNPYITTDIGLAQPASIGSILERTAALVMSTVDSSRYSIATGGGALLRH